MTGKMIFFDIDGTLLDDEKQLPASTRQAIGDLKRAGHGVAIATGRGPFMYKELREQLEIDSFVSYNGQYAVWKGEPIYRNPIQPELINELTEFANWNEHPLVYMDVETMKSNKEYHVHIEDSIATLKVPHPMHDPEYFRGRDIFQTLVFCSMDEEHLYSERFPNLDFLRWHPLSMDVLPLGGSKARGIEIMINKIGVRREDVYAFGDYLNDIEMLKFVGTGIAMGNSPEIVQKAAKHVTRDVKEDGILYGLKMVGLL
jgi:Cof subfamily protein (haloacid dehalogenase superfamily)